MFTKRIKVVSAVQTNLVHLPEWTFDRKRISVNSNPNFNLYPNSNPNLEPKARKPF